MAGDKIIGVLADCFLAPVEAVSVNIAEVKDRKEISDLLRNLEQMCPLEKLKHLKRVKYSKRNDGTDKFEIILCPTVKGENVLQDILSKNICLHKARIANVPAKLPFTRHQFSEASKLWPTKFHEDKRLSKLMEGTLFQKEEVDRIYSHMEQALDVAKTSLHPSQVCIGACIVDPKSNEVVASASDHRHGHPLHHAVMVCIDEVAHGQGTGAFQKYSKHLNYTIGPGSDAKQPKDQSEDSIKENYLCTGLDLYCTREPCVMCAMALVHSRIGRVFYGASDPCGALGTQYKVHTKEGLNHNFEVFKGVLESECISLNMNS
ncbi:probable inactive tRNA-specific adenosine deaminase-like protein 3 [Anneissia japonica]|uniref:probable inactive tRNA-specific adenosine deaminase-like protein 3 n=1 Tax=Anneissia japonica TaxID=1529436 RepID=UPI00142557C1|nr:probable inactive tRNA-specific adenosine deaminase-like protein 3 [Anneissia japonica]